MNILDNVFDILSEKRRRYALYYLSQQNDPVRVDDVAAQIAKWEANGSRQSIPDEKFDQIELELYHNDLPKASQLEYIQFDDEEGLVELTEAPHEIDAVIHVAKVIERPDRNP